jgi:hypothetical protein
MDRNLSLAAVVAALAVVALCCATTVSIGGAWYFGTRTTVVVTPAPLPEITEAPQPGPACMAWLPGETRDLLPGQTALGDVQVAGTIRYDVGGIGEGTIIVNLSSQPISIFAEWGAGCRATVDFKTLINTELLTTGCGGEPCRSVRLVIVSNDGVTEQFFNAPIP